MDGSTLRTALCSSCVLLLAAPDPPQAAMNPEARLAFDLRAAAPTLSCDSLRGHYAACSAISPSRAETGEFQAVIVLYTVESVTAAEYSVRWPAGWQMDAFESCGEFTIGGDVSENPMRVAIAWSSPQEASSTGGIPLGILRGSAPFPGCLEYPNPGPGGEILQVLDAQFQVDPVIEWYAGCIGAPAPADPCAFDSVLVAAFSSDTRAGDVPLAVRFEDRSRGYPTAWLWDFGDGNTSTERHPVYVYTACGVFDVSLAVSRDGESDDTTRVSYLRASEPVIPQFTHEPETGCRPLAVAFRDGSLGHPGAWFWTFGDGGSSTERDPVHTYAAPGLYTVGLTATNACTTATAYRPYAVAVGGPPSAGFAADRTTGCAPATIRFEDRSAGLPTTWLWDFGDGGTSVERHPVHTYAGAGDYDVTLTVANACSASTLARADFIRLGGEFAAEFTADATEGCAPLEVRFTDLSPPGATAWLWEFGGGDVSTEQNPVHAYLFPGVYDVQLTVITACGPAIRRREDYITIPGRMPIAGFSADPIAACAPTEVAFSSLEDTTATGWLWQFGDGATSTEPDPTHRYADPGLYDVTLAVTNACGTVVSAAEDYIVALGPPATAFESTPREFCGSDTVWFGDLSDSTAASWLWEFGDGAASTEREPSHVYPADGVYSVRLTTTNACGAGSFYARDYVNTGIPPVPRFTAGDTYVCEAQQPVYFRDRTPGTVTGWLWEFGDGATSSEQNPSHIYQQDGRYSVGLRVETPCGDAFAGIPEYITVLPDTTEDCRGPVATLLLGPDAVGREDGVLVRWTIQPPSPFTGYFVARAAALAGPWSRLNETAIPDRGAAGARSYEFLDGSARADAARYYRLEAVRGDGSRTEFTIPGAVAAAASAQRFPVLWMGTPSPQPSAGTTRFELGLPAAARAVDLALFDPAGRRVATIYAGTLAEGRQAVVWDGRDGSGRAVPAGIYFVRASAAGQSETRKLILAR